MSESSNRGTRSIELLLAVGTFTLPLIIEVLQALRERRETKVNQYQVAVSANEPVSQVGPVLEEMAKQGIVNATGDVSNPNERLYQLA